MHLINIACTCIDLEGFMMITIIITFKINSLKAFPRHILWLNNHLWLKEKFFFQSQWLTRKHISASPEYYVVQTSWCCLLCSQIFVYNTPQFNLWPTPPLAYTPCPLSLSPIKPSPLFPIAH